MIRYLVLCFTVFLFSSSPVSAQSKSVYTDLNLDRCPVIDQAEEGDGEWVVMRCAGVNGMPVFVAEADLRFSLGYGANGRQQQSASQFLGPFNTIGKKLEWRLKNGRVSATILRYFTETGSEGAKGQILVVTKVSWQQSCHAAYVDALANKGANVLAQYAADYIAPYFKCGQDDPIHLGKRGVSPF